MIPVAFSAECTDHNSSGSASLIQYNKTHLASDFWNGNTFTAPQPGIYHFAISFVKDGFGDDTEDDVFVYFYLNGGYKARAWSGQDTGKRGTGSMVITLFLNANDAITTKGYSDGGDQRRIRECHFTGYAVSLIQNG